MEDITEAPTTTEATTEAPKVWKNSNEVNTVGSAGMTNNTIRLQWEAVTDADGYEIYACLCGKKLSGKTLTKTVSGETLSATLKKIAGDKIFATQEYKVQIKPIKWVDGKKVYLGKSWVLHVVGEKNDNYTNVRKIVVAKKNITLKLKKTAKIKAKIKKKISRSVFFREATGRSCDILLLTKRLLRYRLVER